METLCDCVSKLRHVTSMSRKRSLHQPGWRNVSNELHTAWAGSHWAAAVVRKETPLAVVMPAGAPVLNQADRFNGSEELVHSQRVLYSLLDCTGELNVLFWNKLSWSKLLRFIELCHGLSKLWLYSVFMGSSVKVSVSSMVVKHVQYVVRAHRAALPIVYRPFPEFLLFPLSLS